MKVNNSERPATIFVRSFNFTQLTQLDKGNYSFQKLYEVKNGRIVLLKGTIKDGKLNYTTEYSVGKGSGILTVEGEK